MAEYNSKDISIIPKGLYCHGAKMDEVCPYWGIDTEHPYLEQENGYCSYLEKSDWDLNEEEGEIEFIRYKDGKEIGRFKDNPHNVSLSLLWDQCKECGINNDIF